MGIKVSIIVGCYNVAKWLRDGRLNDIYNQTYANWELILVDDGSTDDTPAILDAEAERDNRIKVIHKENSGLGSARNAGLDVALGDWIWSFDVDDHVEPDCIEYCVNEAEKRNVEMLMFGFNVVTPHLNTKESIALEETAIKNQQELKDIFLDRILFIPNGNGFFWNKFYRRSFIEKNHLRFGNQRIQQDEIFNLDCYRYLSKIFISPKIFYTYYIYESGNNRSKFISNRFDIYKAVRQNFESLKSNWGIQDSRFNDYIEKRFYSSVLQCMLYNIKLHDCPWNRELKKKEMSRIMTDPLTIQSFNWAESNVQSFEQVLYRKACNNQSLVQISLYTSIFNILRKIKRILN